jgi:hypothetical protein
VLKEFQGQVSLGHQVVDVLSVASHRNGISGEGFHVIIFKDLNSGENNKYFEGPFVATVFNDASYVAVYHLETLAKGEIRAGHNSWRGDHYEPVLRQVIIKHGEHFSKELERLADSKKVNVVGEV